MKLLRFGSLGLEKPGILDNEGNIRSLEGIVDDISSKQLSENTLPNLSAKTILNLPIVDSETRIGPCITNVGKFVCIGLNYKDHAEESGQPVPKEPVVFMKATSSITGPNDNIELLPGSKKTDWEVELGVVIGREAKYINKLEALNYVAGYTIINDVSEREWQLERGGNWVKGKSADSYGPIGPWLVTPDEIPDPQQLNLWLEVNGIKYQNGNTGTMIFGVAHIISYLSHCMSLQPGDVIATGTPKGVGMGMNPNIYLTDGDIVRLGIESLGIQQQTVVEYQKPI